MHPNISQCVCCLLLRTDISPGPRCQDEGFPPFPAKRKRSMGTSMMWDRMFVNAPGGDTQMTDDGYSTKSACQVYTCNRCHKITDPTNLTVQSILFGSLKPGFSVKVILPKHQV